jgi:hypothetical protein
MHQSLSRCKLTLQGSRNYCKRRKIDDAKEDLCLYCGGKNNQARDYPIKASALKLHKVQNISMSSQLKVEDAESENEDVKPQ